MIKKLVAPLITLIVLLTTYVLYVVDHFSLSEYFIVATVYLFLMNLLCSNKKPSDLTHLQSITTYFGVVALSFLVFYNYYLAKDDIYSNLDHHALEWKGYQLPENGLLYGQSTDAFLQDTASMGTLHYELQRGDTGQVTSIRITANGLARSFFVGKHSESMGRASSYCNQNTTLPKFGTNGICFENRKDSTRLRLQIIEVPQSPIWPWGGPERDSVLYVFTVTTQTDSLLCTDTLRNSLLIQKSYEIAALIPIRTVSVFGSNLNHFNIVRQRYRTEDKPYTWNNYGLLKRGLVYLGTLWPFEKEFCSFRNQDYLIEQTKPNDDITVISDNANSLFFETTLAPGDPFFLGFGHNSTPRMYFNQRGQLLFDLPQWRPLTTEGDQVKMLVSSSNHKICDPKKVSPYNLLFLPPQVDASDNEPAYEGNNHLFTTNISFAKGPTNEELRLRIAGNQVVRAGEEFLIDCEADDQAKAVMQLTDFKQKTHFQPWPFFRTLLLIFLIAALSMLVSIRYMHNHNLPINTEMACIVLLIVLFTTRYVMCWRMSVFPPMEDLTRLEYDKFVNSAPVSRHLTFFLPLALLLLPICKLLHLMYRIRREEMRLEEDMYPHDASQDQPSKWMQRFISLSPWLPLLLVLLESIVCIMVPRGFQILLPVACYFLLDLLFTNFIIDEADTHHPWRGLDYGFTFPFVLNYVAHLGLLTMLDAGFGVMFLFFGIVRYYLMLCRSFLRRDKKKKHIKWWILTIVVLALILSFLYFSTNLVAAMMNNATLGCVIIAVAIALVVLLFAWGINSTANYHFTKKPAFIGIVTVFLILSSLASIPIYDHVLGPDGHYTHLRYRTKVLIEDWEDILNNERVGNANNVQRFRQTSENQWIIDYYYKNRPKSQDHYFQMQPMSKIGAMWGAQTTDLSFLRFGIGEHGMSFAVGLLLLMLMIFSIAMHQPREPKFARKEARRNIALGALLLILIQSIFVWMSVTNKFIFFGQDFPMLSMTSKMTIYYVIFLLLIACLYSVPHPKQAAKTPIFNKNEHQLAWVFTAMLAFFCIFLHAFQGEGRKNKEIERYTLELKSVKKVLHAHNSLFRYYQIQSNRAFNQLVLSTTGGYNLYGKQLFSDFNKNVYLNLDEEHENILSPDCLVDLGEEGSTTQFPLVANGSNLRQPLLDLYYLRRNTASARLEMSPDSVTLQFRFPQDSLYTAQERSLITTINQLFISYQIENRSLHLAELYVGKKGDAFKKAAKSENKVTEKLNHRLLRSTNFTSMMLDYSTFLDSARQHRGLQNNVTIDTLLARIENIDHTDGATFTNSLIDAYMNNYSKNNSPNNIIYLRRDRTTSYLQFHINDKFFHIPDDQRLWRGDIVACDAEINNLLLKREDGTPVYGKYKHYDHFDVARIPSSWLQGEDDQYLFKANANIRLMLKTYEPIEMPYNQQWSALKLSNTDGASVIETGNKVSVMLPDDLHHVFAKNIQVNGKRRHVYTLGKHLFWMKPYSDYVSSVMADSINDGHPEAKALQHVVSLDYGLSDTLYQFIDSIGRQIYLHESNEKLREANLSVFVGNSNGEIIAMPEYIGKAMYRLNPNDQLSIMRFQQQSSIFSDYTDERNLNGNQNLQPLTIGPGSSLKPLTFGAVSSSFATDWNQFQLLGVLEKLSVDHYAEKKFKRGEREFTSGFYDEPEFGKSFYVAEYLSRSSNYFNSVVTFIGSFSEASLQNGIFAPASSPLTKREFPVMSVDGSRMKFGTLFKPLDIDARPILMKRFLDNYGVYSEPTLLDSTYLDLNTLDPALRNYSRQRVRRNGKKQWLMASEAWVTAEPSFIDFPLRADDEQLSYAQKIKTVTLGMRRVVSITPIKMGEMFSRMFLLDNRFHFTVSQPKPYTSSVNYMVPAYNNTPDGYLAMLQGERSFFQGMKHCVMTDDTEDGIFYCHSTAKYMNPLVNQLRNRPEGPLYMYGKTGTIDNNNINQANLLAIVITNADMRHVSISNGRMVAPNGQPLKFYVIYMALDKTLKNSWQRNQRPLDIRKQFQIGIVRRVINSSRFRQFFNN